MAKGRKTGGRQKGAKNKRTVTVEETLARVGCDPIEGMAMIARGLDPETKLPGLISMDTRAKMFSELAQYVAPKRRALEHTGAEGGPVIMSWLPPPAA